MAKDENKRVTRGMPNDVDAEASVLGSILIDNKAADIIIPMLKADNIVRSQLPKNVSHDPCTLTFQNSIANGIREARDTEE